MRIGNTEMSVRGVKAQYRLVKGLASDPNVARCLIFEAGAMVFILLGVMRILPWQFAVGGALIDYAAAMVFFYRWRKNCKNW